MHFLLSVRRAILKMHTVGENIIGAHKMHNYYLHFCLLFGIISLPLCFISLSLVSALPTMAKAKLSLFLALKGNRNKFIFAFAIAFMDEKERQLSLS
jgi:uncharacterized membrane protein